MKDRKLTEKQKLFIDYYIMTNGNSFKAARLAGYKHTRIGQVNLNHPVIKAQILERQKALENERIADIKEVFKYWTRVMRGEVNEQYINSQGEETKRGVRTCVRLRASEDLAKIHGELLRKPRGPVRFNIISDISEDDKFI